MTSTPDAADTASRTRLEADQRREQIIVAARRLFGERPYEAVSTGDIAAAAGTTRTNVHYHFRSKRDLFLEVIKRFSKLPDDLEVPVRQAGSSLDEQIARVLGRWLDAIERNHGMFMTMLRATSSSDPQVSGVLSESMRAWEHRLIVLLAMDPEDPAHRAMIRSFQAMISDATAAWLDTQTLTKPQVHALLCGCLRAVGEAAQQHR